MEKCGLVIYINLIYVKLYDVLLNIYEVTKMWQLLETTGSSPTGRL